MVSMVTGEISGLVSEPIALNLGAVAAAVYRLWDANDCAVYVGQTRQLHPLMRIAGHRGKSWWPEVARADYIEVHDPGMLDAFEMEQIRTLKPKYNRRGTGRTPASVPQVNWTVSPRRKVGFDMPVRTGPVATHQYKILTALRDAAQPLTPLQVTAATGLKYSVTRVLLSRMTRRGEVARVSRGLYRAPAAAAA